MIAVAGINFQSKGFASLSRNAVAQKAVVTGNGHISGWIVVQTCSRLEIYMDLNLQCKKSAERILLQHLGISGRTNETYIYFEDDAILHLFKVASGLEADFLGEDQVLYQLKQALKRSLNNGWNSPILDKLFQQAFGTGKQVQNLIRSNKECTSAVFIATEVLQSFRKEYQMRKNEPVLIIGAGETGTLITQLLLKKGYKNVQVWSRTFAKAKKIAIRDGVTAIPVESLQEHYNNARMVVVAISKKTALLDFNHEGQGKVDERIIVDLSLPFQVPGTIQSGKCFLYNLDAIAVISQENSEKRKEAVDDAMQLVWASFYEFKNYKEQEWIGQSCQQWKVSFQQVRDRQLKLFSKQHPNADLKTLSVFADELSGQFLRQLAWTFRQQERDGNEVQQWSRLLSTVEPFDQLN